MKPGSLPIEDLGRVRFPLPDRLGRGFRVGVAKGLGKLGDARDVTAHRRLCPAPPSSGDYSHHLRHACACAEGFPIGPFLRTEGWLDLIGTPPWKPPTLVGGGNGEQRLTMELTPL